MDKIKSLNLYQKGLLLVMLAMVLVFAAVYSVTIRRVGFDYKDTILVPSQEDDSTVYTGYTGKLGGQTARFTVSADKTVVFQYGDTTYGPYTIRQDPAAVPQGDAMADDMTGVELRQGADILFRGGVLKINGQYLLFNEDGTSASIGFSYVTSDGTVLDENGDPVDPAAPSASTLLALMDGPALTHKGDWFAWLFGTFLCVLNALSILFADRLFRWYLSFRIRNAYEAEPADWEIAGRYVGWTVMPMLALVLFITGLQ